MTSNTIKINLNSEIGKLKAVILHTPGSEIQNMTPENAESALYSDILNMQVAQEEYSQLSGVLDKLTNTFQVKNLLEDILQDNKVRENLIAKICKNEGTKGHTDTLDNLANKELAHQLIEGVPLSQDNLTAFLSKNRYKLKPLHNFFFTRDASIAINNKVLISKMANSIRERESIIMQSIFDSHPAFSTSTINPNDDGFSDPKTTIEGGDVLIARENVLVIGLGKRTSPQGVDYILSRFQEHHTNLHIIVQELPESPESFIHLDMVFTFLDKNKCMIYEPLITKPNHYKTVHISVENGKTTIKEEKNILVALKNLNIDLEPIICGGTVDTWTQQREQWHSGANFFAVEPGKIIGYERNHHTIEQLNQHGFEIIKSADIINGKKTINDYKRCIITIAGSELSRGGGGARCMTMPISREDIKW